MNPMIRLSYDACDYSDTPGPCQRLPYYLSTPGVALGVEVAPGKPVKLILSEIRRLLKDGVYVWASSQDSISSVSGELFLLKFASSKDRYLPDFTEAPAAGDTQSFGGKTLTGWQLKNYQTFNLDF